MLVMGDTLNLREAADALGIEPWRLARLGRYLRIDPAEKCIPRAEVQRLAGEDQVDDRYHALRRWVMESRSGEPLPSGS